MGKQTGTFCVVPWDGRFRATSELFIKNFDKQCLSNVYLLLENSISLITSAKAEYLHAKAV